jgi:hypothetical protein
MKTSVMAAMLALTMAVPGAAFAQSSGASPADPNNERNQRPAPSNAGPADPGTDTPEARIPTAPEDRYAADREEGGSDGASSGEGGYVVEPDPPYGPYVPD